MLADDAGPGGIPLARPDKPVKLPLTNEAIKSGLEAEKGGTFNIYNYADYVDPNLLKAFSDKYGVTATVTTFDSIDEAITKLGSKRAIRRAMAARAAAGSLAASPPSGKSSTSTCAAPRCAPAACASVRRTRASSSRV